MGKTTLLRDIAEGIAKKATEGIKPFFSAADKAAQELPRTKGTGAEFMRELEKAKGVKPAEIQHRKLDEIKSKPKMTKEEFVKEVQARKPAQVEEKVLREPTDKDLEIEAEKLMRKDAENYVNETYGQRKFKDKEKWDDFFNDEFERLMGSEKEYYLDQAFERYKSGDANIGTMYGEYQLPGGENYREILLKLPEGGLSRKEASDKVVLEAMAGKSKLSPENQAYLNELLQKEASLGTNYRSRHWEGEPNVLAHMRVSDRTGPNGEKVLHVEEIQSDWHQAGRKARDKEVKRIMQEKGISRKEASALVPESFGYKAGDIDKRIDDLNEEMNVLSKQRDPVTNKMLDEPKWFDLAKQRDALVKQSVQAVPDAPFKKNWQELAMNRLLSYAAENGYDRVALTPGAEQASRYDLSKHVKNIYHSDNADGTFHASVLSPEGKVIWEDFRATPEKIEETLGKDIAGKIINGLGEEEAGMRRLDPEDMKMGGEGMKGFYDKMLPEYLNKLGKKYGVEVNMGGDKVMVPSNENFMPEAVRGPEWKPSFKEVPIHTFDITPEMRKDITEQGFPLYSAIAAPVGLAGAQDAAQRVGITDDENAMKLDLMDQELREPEQNFDKGGAAFGVFPQMKGKRSKQDREASKNVPVDLLRGAVSGVLGAPGDIESLIRLLPGLNEETVLPTSEDIEKRLPFKSDTPVSQAATGLGQLAGGFYTGPGSPLKAAAGVPKAIKHGAEEFAKATAMGVPRLDVWHGTPHKFPPTAKNPLGEFDPSKIGTGEGAQAYGHGHYAAEAKKVGSSYRPRSPEYEEKLIGLYNKAQSSSNYPMMEVLEDAMMHSDPEDILKRFTDAEAGYTPAHAKAAQDFAKWYAKNPPEVGSLYRVDLPDEAVAKMLQWDKPLTEQPKSVQQALQSILEAEYSPKLVNALAPNKTGRDILGHLESELGGAKVAAQYLREAGVPGIKYLDDGSRGFGEGTSNFVVFPGGEDLLNIVESKAEGGRVKPPSEEMREKLRQLRESFLPAANEAERQKRMQQNMEQTTRKVSFSDDPEMMRQEVHMNGGGEIKASPRDEAWGTAADIAKALEEASKSQFGYSNPATEKIAEFFGLPGLARTLERKAYGFPITNIGVANVGLLPDDTVDALLAVAPLGKPIAKGAKAAAKAAAGEVEKAMFGESSSKLLNELTPQVMSAYKPHTPLKPDPEVGTRYKVTDTGGLAPRKDLNIEDLQNSQVKIFPWDATSRNKLVTEVSDVPLTKPVLTEGGDDYMRDLKHIEQGIAGASNRGIANRIMGRINQAAVENQLLGGGTGRVFGFPIRMAEKAEYAATFPTDVALDLLKQAGLKKKELKALDENMRNMVFDGERGAFKDMAPFGSPEFEYQLRHGLKSDKQKDIKGFTDMNLRKAFMDRMSMVENQKRMGYNIQDLTGSVLAEELKGVPKGYVGNVAAELEPYGKLRPSKSSTYDTDFPGLYVGSMPNMPVEFLMPRTFENIYREMKALYPHKTQEALRNMTIGAMEKRNKGISEKIEQRAVDATKTYQEGLMKGEFDPNDLTQVYDYMRRKKLELKLAKGGSTGLIEVKKRKAKA